MCVCHGTSRGCCGREGGYGPSYCAVAHACCDHREAPLYKGGTPAMVWRKHPPPPPTHTHTVAQSQGKARFGGSPSYCIVFALCFVWSGNIASCRLEQSTKRQTKCYSRLSGRYALLKNTVILLQWPSLWVKLCHLYFLSIPFCMLFHLCHFLVCQYTQNKVALFFKLVQNYYLFKKWQHQKKLEVRTSNS